MLYSPKLLLGCPSRRRINGIFKQFRQIYPRIPPIPEISMPILTPPTAKMTFGPRDRRQLLRFVLFLLGGIWGLTIAARADESRTLIIPPNDGYGFEECLKPGSACGIVMADAWCKAHGFAGSQGFRPETSGTPDVPAGSVRVTCGGEID
jgi:hypothetical protein